MARKEVEFTVGVGIKLLVTRKGIEVSAWYDGWSGGIEGLSVSWQQIDEAREEVNQVTKNSYYLPNGGDREL